MPQSKKLHIEEKNTAAKRKAKWKVKDTPLSLIPGNSVFQDTYWTALENKMTTAKLITVLDCENPVETIG